MAGKKKKKLENARPRCKGSILHILGHGIGCHGDVPIARSVATQPRDIRQSSGICDGRDIEGGILEGHQCVYIASSGTPTPSVWGCRGAGVEGCRGVSRIVGCGYLICAMTPSMNVIRHFLAVRAGPRPQKGFQIKFLRF